MNSLLHSTRFQALVLSVFVFLLFWWRIGSLPLIDPDEPFYALTTREMVESGDWVTPRIFGEPQFEKPILFYWQTCLSQKLFGESPFASRLPVALAASLVVFLTWQIGRTLLSPLAGFLSAIVLATSTLFVVMSRIMLTDISHTFFISLSMFCLWRAFHDEDRRLKWLIGLTVASALAMLTKGPQGLAFVFMAGLSYSWLTKRKSPWSLKNLAICVPLWMVIALPWFLAMFMLHQSGPTSPQTGWAYYWDTFFVHENWDRLFNAEHQGNNTWYYYLEMLIGGTLPWIPLTLCALGETARSGLNKIRESTGLLFVLCWLLPSYLFMNLAQSKLPSYIFFLLVPLSLVAGKTLARWVTEGFGPKERWVVITFTLIQAILLLGYVPFYYENARPYIPQLMALGLPLALAGILALRRSVLGWVCTASVFNMVVIFIAFFWIEKELEAAVCSKEISQMAKSLRRPNETLISSSFLGRTTNYYFKEKPAAIFVPAAHNLDGKRKENFRPFYPFYSYQALQQVTVEKGLAEFVDKHGTVLCIAEKSDFARLNQAETSSVRGRCELLGTTGDKPGRSIFRIYAKDRVPQANQSNAPQ
ncbi:glycosyltransferase family 39 protein [bacterium]|nr:glycosyltransferase family 39 protein [bacterium]